MPPLKKQSERVERSKTYQSVCIAPDPLRLRVAEVWPIASSSRFGHAGSFVSGGSSLVNWESIRQLRETHHPLHESHKAPESHHFLALHDHIYWRTKIRHSLHIACIPQTYQAWSRTTSGRRRGGNSEISQRYFFLLRHSWTA